MNLNEYVNIRTGLVLSRKEKPPDEGHPVYHALNLKNVTEDGQILLAEIGDYYTTESLKKEYFTRFGDVLLRLSAPYTAVLITENEVGLIIPSHFAVIRTNKTVDSRYLCWWLTKNRKWFYIKASGGTMMGTISSGYIAQMPFEPPPLEQQRKIGELLWLANREQQLLSLLRIKRKQLVDTVLKNYAKDEGEIV
jgi:restriction endonuclease S subunit